MIPYYDDGTCTIYHGDCREVLPNLTADVVLTDAPYGIGLDYGGTFEDSRAYLERLATESLPLMRAAAPVVGLTCGVANMHLWPEPTWTLAWVQGGCGSTGRWGFNQWQPVLVWGTDPYLSRGRGRTPDVIDVRGGSQYDKSFLSTAHPCPKPPSTWRQILKRLSPDEGDVVLDPMMGSGTTLFVCKGGGRRAIGIEIEERYCEIAAKRLGQEVLAL